MSLSVKKCLLISSVVALTLLSNNFSAVVATQVENKNVYKTLSEASKDSLDEVSQPFGKSLSTAELKDYEEKQKVKEDVGNVKKVIKENPELYSGYYYNSDKGTLVVQITQDSKELKDKIDRVVKHKDKIEYQITKYSKKDIEEAKKQIKKSLPGGTVQALIPDTINNKLIVLLDKSENKDRVLSAVSDQGLIQIGEGPVKKEKHADTTDYGTSIPSGARIAGNYQTVGSTTTWSECSTGYYGLNASNQSVLVTTGHCVPVGSSTAWFQPFNTTATIGNFTFRTTSSNPDGSDAVSDAGYIELSNHSGSPTVPYQGTVPIVGAYVWDTPGDTIYMRGATTGSLQSGTIRYANVDIWWGMDGYGYNENQVLAQGYTGQGGDSGGVVLTDYAYDNDRQSYTFDLAGTHSGFFTIQDHAVIDDGTYQVYEPIWMTYNDLSLNGILLRQ